MVSLTMVSGRPSEGLTVRLTVSEQDLKTLLQASGT